jgi:hypothetical protein
MNAYLQSESYIPHTTQTPYDHDKEDSRKGNSKEEYHTILFCTIYSKQSNPPEIVYQSNMLELWQDMWLGYHH